MRPIRSVWVAAAIVLASFAVVAVPVHAVTQTAPPSLLRAEGTSLVLGRTPVHMIGFSAYSLATDWSVNHGCGGQYSQAQMNAFFSSLPSHAMVAFSLFQSAFGIDVATHTINWSPIDRIFSTAARYHVHLVPVLADGNGSCDAGQYKDITWFQNRFRNKAPVSLSRAVDVPSEVVPYITWVRMVVDRYRMSPALGMWEPIGEANPLTCVNEPIAVYTKCVGPSSGACDEAASLASLVHFYTDIGALIRSLDRFHLINEGLLSGRQCGSLSTDWEVVGANRYIDVLSVHDYYDIDGQSSTSSTPGGVGSSSVVARMQQAAQLNKPLVDGEFGIQAGGTGCVSLVQRANDTNAVAHWQLYPPVQWGVPGMAGFMVWTYVPPPFTSTTTSTTPTATEPSCSFSVMQGDPLIKTLRSLH